MFDTGCLPAEWSKNMRRLGISPGEVEVIVLSHGHWDHVTRMRAWSESSDACSCR